jgi:hypothetical protein
MPPMTPMTPMAPMAPAPPMPMPPVMMPPATIPPMPVPPMPASMVPPGATPPMPVPGASMPGFPVPTASPNMPTRALAPSGLPALVADEFSQVGARPLVTDPKLGWSTSVKLPPANDGSSTRLQSDQVNIRLQSSTRWVILSIALVLVVAALVVLILET